VLSFGPCIVRISTMRDVHLRNVDLILLHALHALLEERHVTRAAKRCFLSQPAMSRALERLREMLEISSSFAVGALTSARCGRTRAARAGVAHASA